MELLTAIQLEPFEKVKEIVESKRTTLMDAEYTDYQALNLAIELNRKRIATYLISIDFRVNMKGVEYENTPLHNAVELGDKQMVCDLLMKKASVLAVNHEGNTPLHLAFLKRYDQITELILNVMFVHEFFDYNNVKNKQGLSHMHIACTMDNERLVQFFLNSGANVEDAVNKNSPYCPGYTAMYFAVEYKCIEVARLLMDVAGTSIVCQGEDIEDRSPIRLAFEHLMNSQMLFYHMTAQNKDNDWGYYKYLSQFHMACLGDYPEFVETFISHGAALNTPLQPEATFCPGYTPLHCAVESNCKENVELLLKNGAKVERLNYHNMSPLHLALYNESPNNVGNGIVDLLYAATEDKKKNVVDLNNLSYMHVAVTRGDVKTVKMFLRMDKSYVNQTVSYNLRNFAGFTPLHFAVRYDQLEMAELLIKHGADVNANDNADQGSPLHLAFQTGSKRLVDLLLAGGARADFQRTSDDKTVLHLLVEDYVDQTEARELVANNGNVFEYWAAKDDLLEFVERLTSLRCDVDAFDSDGNTAMHLACREFADGAPCVRKMLEFGADINLENLYGVTAFQWALGGRYQDNGTDYMMLYHHVQKLKLLELEVNPKNERCCDEILEKRNEWQKHSYFVDDVNYFADEELARRQQQRLDEVARMKELMLDKNVSLYDFVKFDVKTATAYVQNKELVKLFEMKDAKELNEQYPSYGYLIKLRYRRAVEFFVVNGAVKKSSRRVVAKRGRGVVQRRK